MGRINPVISEKRRFQSRIRAYREAVRLVVAEAIPRMPWCLAAFPITSAEDAYYRAERDLLIRLCVFLAEKHLARKQVSSAYHQRIWENPVLSQVPRREARLRRKVLESRANQIIQRPWVRKTIAQVFDRIVESAKVVKQANGFYLDHRIRIQTVLRIAKKITAQVDIASIYNT